MVINMHGLYYLAEKTAFKDTYGDDAIARFFGHGIQTAILGILTVFAVLSLLWGCLEIFKYVFYTLPERRKNEASDAPKAEPAPVPVPAPETTVYASDDGELVAAIMAAISAYRAEEGAPATGFRVVSFRKKSRK